MVTTSADVGKDKGGSARTPKCYGRFFDEAVQECMVCDYRETCSKAMTAPEAPAPAPAQEQVEESATESAPTQEQVEEPATEPEAAPEAAPEATPEQEPAAESEPVAEPETTPEPTPAQEQAEESAPTQEPAAGKVEAPAFEPLSVRANTAGAYAVKCLQEKFWKPADLVEEVKRVCGGKGTKAHDMINRAKRENLLESQGKDEDREVRIKS